MAINDLNPEQMQQLYSKIQADPSLSTLTPDEKRQLKFMPITDVANAQSSPGYNPSAEMQGLNQAAGAPPAQQPQQGGLLGALGSALSTLGGNAGPQLSQPMAGSPLSQAEKAQEPPPASQLKGSWGEKAQQESKNAQAMAARDRAMLAQQKMAADALAGNRNALAQTEGQIAAGTQTPETALQNVQGINDLLNKAGLSPVMQSKLPTTAPAKAGQFLNFLAANKNPITLGNILDVVGSGLRAYGGIQSPTRLQKKYQMALQSQQIANQAQAALEQERQLLPLQAQQQIEIARATGNINAINKIRVANGLQPLTLQQIWAQALVGLNQQQNILGQLNPYALGQQIAGGTAAERTGP